MSDSRPRGPDLDVFPPDYFASRDRFRAAARGLGWVQEAHPLAVPGPNGRELTIDVASGGDAEAAGTLVLSSGLHGAEGFFGAAVQLAVLGRWAAAGPPPGVRVVFLHALNSFGFAHVRRANEDNVDPNRNFLRPGEPYAGSPPAYRTLNRLLNPERPPRRWEPFRLGAVLAILRYGMSDLKQAVAGGQYDFPRGLFFGGSGPTRTMQVLHEHLGRWIGSSSRVVHLDFHTGLGRWATYRLLLDDPLMGAEADRLRKAFGADALEESHPSGVAYVTRGSLGQWCRASFPACEYLYLCAEFGTYPPLHVIAGLRAENQANHWDRPDSPATLRAKQRLRELFCPASPSWRERVLAQGLDLVERGVLALKAGLSES